MCLDVVQALLKRRKSSSMRNRNVLSLPMARQTRGWYQSDPDWYSCMSSHYKTSLC